MGGKFRGASGRVARPRSGPAQKRWAVYPGLWPRPKILAGSRGRRGGPSCHSNDIPIDLHCKTVFFGFYRGGLRYRAGTFFGWWGSGRRYVWWGFASDHVIDDVTGDVITFFETGLNIQITPWLQRFVLGARISEWG